MMKHIFPTSLEMQQANTLPVMFNNAIDCDLSDWSINEKKEIPADLLIPKV